MQSGQIPDEREIVSPEERLTMDDQDYGAAQPIIDVAKGAYKKVNDFFSHVPTPGYDPKTDHDKAVDAMNKKLNDQRVADANKSFATQTAAQKKGTPAPTPGKTMIKTGPRKKM